MDMRELVRDIPMKRWLLASQRLAMKVTDMADDEAMLMLLAANEKAGKESGNFDQFGRFLDMGLIELSDFLTDGESQDEDPDEADKSGGAQGVAEGEGDLLPGDPALP